MQAEHEPVGRPRRRIYPKRLFDLAVAIPAMLILAPLFALVALAVRLNLGRPIFFIQPRPGLEGRPFKLIKFRTMRDDVDPNGRSLSDAERLTGFGRFLRSTSLDELPELWNVVKGEMSLVGPRPLLLHYLDLYTPFQMRRHEMRPGLTGWAQVNGRNALSWPEKFAHDVWYVDNAGFLLDLRILLLTLVRILDRRGITAEGEATMPYFQGETGGEPETGPLPQARGGRSGTEA
jgi:lipopolysaccharide/colanic/teichoic acid biosynthesis glycosyltransferase